MLCVDKHELSVCFWLVIVLSFPDTVCSCGEDMSGRRGELTTPNYPGDYDNNLNCTWTIKVDTHYTITVIFKGFLVEEYNEEECVDHFYVYDGPSTSSAVILHRCGHKPPKPIESSGNSLTFALITDESQTRTGVRLIWRVSDNFTLNTNPVSWSDANAACLKEGGYLAVKNGLSELSLTKLLTNFSGSVWFGDYLTPWVWLKGCYKDEDGKFIPGKYYSESKHSLLQHCQFRCQDSVYFGLQGRKCLCLTSEDMDHIVLSKPSKDCKMSCPGDSDGLCGGETALTVFMNDVCWKNSSTWTGRISRTILGTQCQSWKLDDPHAHHFHGDQMFPDISEEAASNFCRDPSGKGLPWCYTTDKEVLWQFCDIPPCAENANPIGNTDNDELCRVYWTNGSSFFHQQSRCSQNASFACFSDDKGLEVYIVHDPLDFHAVARKGCRYLYGLADYKVFYDLTEKAGVRNTGSHYWVGSLRIADNTKDKDSTPTPSTCNTIRHQENELQTEAQASCDLRFGFVCQTEAIFCGETLSTEDGYISWPVNQTRYNNDENCRWEITVSEGRSITMNLFSVDLEASNSCSYDFIEVSEISGNESKRLHTLCGNATNITVSSSNNAVRIRFKSDSDTTGSGFQLKWWSEPTTTPIQSSEPDHSSTSHYSQKVTNTMDNANYPLEGGAIAGIVAGGVIIIIVLAIVLAVLVRRHRLTAAKNQEPVELQRNIRPNDDTPISDANPEDVYSEPVPKQSRNVNKQSFGEQQSCVSGDIYYDHLHQGPSANVSLPGSSNTYDKLPTGDIYDHTTQATASALGEEYGHLGNKNKDPRPTESSEYNSLESTIKQPVKRRDDYEYVVQETTKADNK